jgi:hypothetical protein
MEKVINPNLFQLFEIRKEIRRINNDPLWKALSKALLEHQSHFKLHYANIEGEKIEPPIIIGNQVFRRRMKINKWYTY